MLDATRKYVRGGESDWIFEVVHVFTNKERRIGLLLLVLQNLT